MEEIKSILVNMYPWARLESTEVGLKILILNDFTKILEYPIKVIPRGIKIYMYECNSSKDGYNTDDMSKLYILNRYLFDLPEYVDINEPRFAAIRGIPVDKDKVNLLWPFEKTQNKELKITGIFKGYSGESLQALQEFDFFKNKYGVKKAHI